MGEYLLKYGRREQRFTIDEEFCLEIISPGAGCAVNAGTCESAVNPSEVVEAALDHPIESKRLEEIAEPGAKVAVIVSDITRPSPTKLLIRPILSRLKLAGVSASDVVIVIADGMHRSHTAEERIKMLGAEVLEAYQCVDSVECEFIRVGVTSRGTPVEISRPLAEADLIVATGNVEFHYFAGFSGGAKAVLPGCASKTAIEKNHSMQLDPRARAGVIQGNPVREDIEEAGQIAGLDFIVNAVLDEEKNLVSVYAGHPIACHKRCVEDAIAIYGMKISHRYDLVIASAGGYPKDINLYQAQKALENASRAVEDGGTVILVAQCSEGFGNNTFKQYMSSMTPDKAVSSIAAKFVLGGHKAAAIARVVQRASVFLVSEFEDPALRNFGIEVFPTVSEALAEWERRRRSTKGKPSVAVMPYAGSTVPLLD